MLSGTYREPIGGGRVNGRAFLIRTLHKVGRRRPREPIPHDSPGHLSKFNNFADLSARYRGKKPLQKLSGYFREGYVLIIVYVLLCILSHSTRFSSFLGLFFHTRENEQ